MDGQIIAPPSPYYTLPVNPCKMQNQNLAGSIHASRVSKMSLFYNFRDKRQIIFAEIFLL